jgi:hypothetical protein
MPPAGKVRCDDCDRWLTVEEQDDIVECECGAWFAVTITPVSVPPA